MTIEVYEDKRETWRWRMLARNGQVMWASSEAFDSRGNALRSARRCQKLVQESADVDLVILDSRKVAAAR